MPLATILELPLRRCSRCDGGFAPRASFQRFCSTDCRREANRALLVLDRPTDAS